MEEPSKRALRRLALSPVPLFVLASLFLLWAHEPWRDEAQPWLIVKDSPHFLRELDSEASPGLWYLLQLPLAKLGLPFVSVRLLHLVLAAAALSVLVLRGPFHPAHQWLFAFGYFVLYEYNAIARSYVLLMLLAFLAAALHRRRLERPLLYGSVLALLANANAHGMLLASALALLFALDLARAKRLDPLPLGGVALALAAVLLAYAQMIPAEDLAEWRTGTTTGAAAMRATTLGVVEAFLPISSFDWTWNLVAFSQAEDGQLVLLALALYGASVATFRRNPSVLALYLLVSLAFLATFYLKSETSNQMRHHGLLFVVFVFCLWLHKADPPAARHVPKKRARPWTGRGEAIGVTALLLAHVLGAIPAVVAEAREPFSAGPAAAQRLRDEGLAAPDALLAFHPAFLAPSVLVALPADEAYFPQLDAWGSYVRWTEEEDRTIGLDAANLTRRVEEEAAQKGAARIALLVNAPTAARLRSPAFDANWTLVAEFPALARSDELILFEHRCPAGCP